MRFFLCSLLLALVAQQTFAASPCVGSENVDGTQKVVLTLQPNPQAALEAAGLGDSKSPMAMMKLLQTFEGQANAMMTTMRGFAKMFFPFAPNMVPNCRYYWINNQLICDNMDTKIMNALCNGTNMIGNITNAISFPMPVSQSTNQTCQKDNATTGRPWGIDKIRAPEVWLDGYSGQGVVVANIDSGVRATHQDLKDNMRATYNWYDPYNLSPSVPSDVHGHGTHTMGTVCGKSVGVAPNATWIACRGCNSQSCDNEQLIACGQFMFCPDKGKENCTTKPHIINNSWGGGIGNTMYDNVIQMWQKAGIISFFSAGNSGETPPFCANVKSPADGNWTKYEYFSVGSAACDDHISSFSSQGPSQRAEYMGGLGISIVGPGSSIRSAWKDSDTAYNTISGTSQSSPAVAGSAAVLLSKNKNLTYKQLSDALLLSAARPEEIEKTTGGANAFCGGEQFMGNQPTTYPNNVYGYGRVDVKAACDKVTVL